MIMKKGFTLIEVLVSVAIFSVVMVVALGALLSMSVSNRKAETIKSVINNLNFSLDSMARAIRTGSNYHCGSSGTLTTPQDCTVTGANYITFLSAGGQQTYYRLDTNASVCGQPSGPVGCISRSTDGTTWLAITAPEVIVRDLSTSNSYLFYVKGSVPQSSGDTFQPKVNMTLAGYVQVSVSQTSPFNLQTSVTQRVYDQ